MLSWFQALLPKEDNFFRLFDAHAATLTRGADALRHMLDGGETVSAAAIAAGTYFVGGLFLT